MPNQDYSLIEEVKNLGTTFYTKEKDAYPNLPEFPLDESIIKDYLEKITLREEDDEYRIFNHIELIKKLWRKVIEKSIKCLRYFDVREPFLKNPNKHPIAYGVTELSEYFDKYSEFESMLYGSGKYYRDHVIHVIRTWLLGLECLLKDDYAFLERINIENLEINQLEKLSIWSIIALTHDLGYPLEKSQSIIEKTKDMMKSFIANPLISMDLSFNGVQNNMNDFVVRFMSSKMHEVKSEEIKPYTARLQPKYYFKFQKSLEKSQHGILSSIIIYKLLLYFLESDYSINEDYKFTKEDSRQFYIRREILRSIAAHTCGDIYHLEMLSFAYLLIVVDDLQEWGRKRLSELYVKPNVQYELSGITFEFDKEKKEPRNIHICHVKEKFNIQGKENVSPIIVKNLILQHDRYNEIFRDGQDTERRNFTFSKESEFSDDSIVFLVDYVISYDKESVFKITISKKDGGNLNDNSIPEFLKDNKTKEHKYKEKKVDDKKYTYTLIS